MYKRTSVKCTPPSPSSLPHGKPKIPIPSVFSQRYYKYAQKFQANSTPHFICRIFFICKDLAPSKLFVTFSGCIVSCCMEFPKWIKPSPS